MRPNCCGGGAGRGKLKKKSGTDQTIACLVENPRFWSKVSKTESCWLWTGCTNRDGCGELGAGKSSARGLAHRISYAIHFGAIPDGLCVCHRCDIKICVNPSHLFLGTHADNMRDRDAKGRNVRGVASPEAKLTESQVRDIRAMHASGKFSQRALAKQFGVGQPHISSVCRIKTWKHIG